MLVSQESWGEHSEDGEDVTCEAPEMLHAECV